MLNKDGSHKKDEHGEPIHAYTNDEIMSFARIWTGFDVRSSSSVDFVCVYSFQRLTFAPLFDSSYFSTNRGEEILKITLGMATEST